MMDLRPVIGTCVPGEGTPPLPPGVASGYMNPSRKIFQKIFIKKFSYSGPVACAFAVMALLSKVV